MRAANHAAALGLTSRVLAESAQEEVRRSAISLHQAALEHLPAETAATIEAYWRDRPFAEILAEFGTRYRGMRDEG